MADLQGRTIVVLEARMPSELAGLVTRHGGRALNAPALREVTRPLDQEVADLVGTVCARRASVVIFLTGVGARAILRSAEELGKKEDFLQALRLTRVVCRGPKPLAVMRANDVPVALVPPEPFTSDLLPTQIRALGWDLNGETVALQHYGEVNHRLRADLQAMGAQVIEASVYEWALPEDLRPLEDAIRAVVERRVDAVAFTTQSQVRHLFQIAGRLEQREALKMALQSDVAAAPVGPLCVRALVEEGVTPHVVPEHPKMGPLVLALADFFARNPRPPYQAASVAPARSLGAD